MPDAWWTERSTRQNHRAIHTERDCRFLVRVSPRYLLFGSLEEGWRAMAASPRGGSVCARCVPWGVVCTECGREVQLHEATRDHVPALPLTVTERRA